jgi:hypothetical protein
MMRSFFSFFSLYQICLFLATQPEIRRASYSDAQLAADIPYDDTIIVQKDFTRVGGLEATQNLLGHFKDSMSHMLQGLRWIISLQESVLELIP